VEERRFSGLPRFAEAQSEAEGEVEWAASRVTVDGGLPPRWSRWFPRESIPRNAKS
jgi:hypothetical protein